MDQLPQPVKSTVQREGKGKSPESMTKSTDDKGAVAYEVKYLDGSKETTVAIASNGKVTSRNTRTVGNEPSSPKSDMKPDDKPDTSKPNDSHAPPKR